MGQGDDMISRSFLEYQPTAVLEFFQIYPDTISKPDMYIAIHGGSNFSNPIFWQGIEYFPMPIESEGFEINGNGQLARPKIRIANKDYLMTSLLQNNQDFKNAKVVRKRTFVKYIDDINFDGGNPFGQANSSAEISSEDFLVGQKTSENKIYIELELTSPLDLDNLEVTSRSILAKYCYWTYRGNGCNYKGLPIEKEDGSNFSCAPTITQALNQGLDTNKTLAWTDTVVYGIGDIVYLENKKVTIQPLPEENTTEVSYLKIWYICKVADNRNNFPESNPSFWEKDGCSKKVAACKKRFNSNNFNNYVIGEVTKAEDYIYFSGSVDRVGYANPYSTGSLQLNSAIIPDGNFSIHGWYLPLKNSMNNAGLFQTNQKSYYTTSFYLNDYDPTSNINPEQHPVLMYNVDTGVGILPNNAQSIYENNENLDIVGRNKTGIPVQFGWSFRRNLGCQSNLIRWSDELRATESSDYWLNRNCSVVLNSDNYISGSGPLYERSGKLLTVSGGSRINAGITHNNFNNSLSTDLNIKSPLQWKDYSMALEFSIYVKVPAANAYRYMYFKVDEATYANANPNTPTLSTKYAIFDLQSVRSSYVAPIVTNITNLGNTSYYPIYISAAPYDNYWYLTFKTFDKSYIDPTLKKSISGISFGPLPGTTAPIYTLATTAGVTNFTADYGNGTSGVLIALVAMQNGGGQNNTYKSTGKPNLNKDFNIDGYDAVYAYKDGKYIEAWRSANKNQTLIFPVGQDRFSLGLSNFTTSPSTNPDPNLARSPNGYFMSWSIHNKELSFDDYKSLRYEPNQVENYSNPYPYYPVQYQNITQALKDSTLAWWDMNINPSNSSQILNEKNSATYPLTISNGKSGSIFYNDQITQQITKKGINSNILNFGGFPGTEGFAYGG